MSGTPGQEESSMALQTEGWAPYERAALGDIRAWARRLPSLQERAWAAAERPAQRLFRLALRSDAVRATFDRGMAGLLETLTELATATVPLDATLRRYQAAGQPDVRVLADVGALPLAVADKLAAPLRRGYVTALTIEGGSAGLASLASPPAALLALAADVPFVLAGALRAGAEYARTYGFDPNDRGEQELLFSLVSLSTELAEPARAEALAGVCRLADDLSAGATWRDLDRHALTTTVRTVGQRLGVRLTQRKLAAVVPGVGALVGAGFNASYAQRVCDTAQQLSRARFLARRHDVALAQVAGVATSA